MKFSKVFFAMIALLLFASCGQDSNKKTVLEGSSESIQENGIVSMSMSKVGETSSTNPNSTSQGSWCAGAIPKRVHKFLCGFGNPGASWVMQPDNCYHQRTATSCACTVSDNWLAEATKVCQGTTLYIKDTCGFEKWVTYSPVCSNGGSVLQGKVKTWRSFWGVNFPNPRYGNVTEEIARNEYVAFKFNTGDVIDSGAVVSVGVTSTSGVRKGSISERPGDFNVSAACSHTWGLGGGISWATDGSTGACKLKPNTDYYLNITFTDGKSSNTSTCKSTRCIIKLQHTNR